MPDIFISCDVPFSKSSAIQGGWREKCHFCIARYLEEMYVKKDKLEREWVDLFDRLRETRHADQYDVSYFATREEAESALNIALEFVERMEKLLDES